MDSGQDLKRGFDFVKLVPVLVVVLVVASFFIGNLSAKVAYLEGGAGKAVGDDSGGQVAGQQAPQPAEPASEIDKAKFDELAKGSNVIGKKNASVTIVEFSDFQCPFCKSFFTDTFSQIKKEYIDSGKVKLVYRHFPLTAIHPFAMGAAIGSECAAEQGKFEAYHDKLFQNQTAISVSDLKKYAADLRLNTNKFNECLDSEKYKDKVNEDMRLGSENGINGTPGFFVNGKLISGAQPFGNFKSVIEEALGGN